MTAPATGYLGFLRENGRAVAFGALLTLLSSFGQTFFVALSAPGIRAEFGFSEGRFGLLYAGATLAAGLLLGWAGRLIDRTTSPRYTAAVGLGLAAGCAGMALAAQAWMVALLYVVLRLCGQGLTTHTAMTVTARRFPRDAGKALGLVALGLVIGEAVLPPGAVALLPGLGWRGLWWVACALVLLGLLAALWALDAPGAPPPKPAGGSAPPVPLWRDRRFLLMQPALQAPPFIMTGFLFNQVRLAEEMGWAMAVYAGTFIVFALMRAAGMLFAGPVIDRLGAARLLPAYLLPLAVAMAALGLGQGSHASALVFMVMAGLTNGVVATLGTALAAQLYGAERLAAVRSAIAGGLLIAAALAPACFGLLLDAGIGLRAQAAACLVALVAASLLTLPVARWARQPASPG